ncbi:hypothetical protein [Novosphingobium sp. 9]|uniref:hypothetical protein n=1 Tax=Novosphingobium sp. 9 TaxID=2025349 RepID=UPI0021B6848E|nr:hypothetical protein [Novosphingobium sp. 9]
MTSARVTLPALPYPNKVLWPNGRTRSTHLRAREVKKHKLWGYAAALSTGARFAAGTRVGLHIIVHAKPRGPMPDKDNVVASIKSYQDGIAQALGIDDRHFETPTVEFAETRTGEFVIQIGGVE